MLERARTLSAQLKVTTGCRRVVNRGSGQELVDSLCRVPRRRAAHPATPFMGSTLSVLSPPRSLTTSPLTEWLMAAYFTNACMCCARQRRPPCRCGTDWLLLTACCVHSAACSCHSTVPCLPLPQLPTAQRQLACCSLNCRQGQQRERRMDRTPPAATCRTSHCCTVTCQRRSGAFAGQVVWTGEGGAGWVIHLPRLVLFR